jgi:hypothetical protein
MTLMDLLRRLWKNPPHRRPFRRCLLELESLEERAVPAFLVTTNQDNGDDANLLVNSLRWAIVQANKAGGQNTIEFRIGAGAQTINIQTNSLPTITSSLIIDAANQNGQAGQTITIAPDKDHPIQNNPVGLEFAQNSSNSQVLSLTVKGFAGGDGIRLNNVSFVGLNNVTVSGNQNGIHVTGANAHDNTVVGSLIGNYTNPMAQNTQFGVLLDAGANNNTIGAPGAGNINTISGNMLAGVDIQNANNNTLFGNYIGTASDGSSATQNAQGTGVRLEGTSTGNLIGGTVAIANGSITTPANVISNNNSWGVAILGTGSNNRVQGNFIGTDKTGNQAVGNGADGVIIVPSGNIVGGAVATLGNVISANGAANGFGSGVDVGATNNTINFNKIGVGNDGKTVLGNNGSGVLLDKFSSGNTLGNNTIKNNKDKGVLDRGQNNSILPSNTIAANIGLGIDNGNGIDTTGMPVLVSATSDGTTTTVSGTLRSTPRTNFVIGIFGNLAPDPSGYGQGEELLGTVNVTTDVNGNASFTATISAVYGTSVSATATDLDHGGTSEFAANLPITYNPPSGGSSSIGSWVWLDTNGTGIYNPSDIPVAGVVVTLTSMTTGQTWTTTTDSYGHYLFANLAPDTYSLTFTLPVGYAFTQEQQGDPILGSQANPLTGNTAVFTLGASQFDLAFDAGLIPA